MDETLLFPSPNWFLVSNLAVSKDGWVIYGGPSKSICILEPLNGENRVISGNQTYRAHVASRAHPERVVSVDICPTFAEKRTFISGGQDGSVKHWILEKVNNLYKIKTNYSHEVHCNEKDEIAGVGYSTETVAITVGSCGTIVKWDLNSNVCKTYDKFMPSFKASCMSCSPHLPLHVAIGTKQGVVFVVDLEDTGKVVYKVRGHDEEITSFSWCPQYEVLLHKTLKEIQKAAPPKSQLGAIKKEQQKENVLNQSGLKKNLPEDSFDNAVVDEDDMFDIYKDHEADEFGHKKYEPENILVKVKEEKDDLNDFLDECLKLKEVILRKKNEEEPSIESLVDAMDKTRVDSPSDAQGAEAQAGPSKSDNVEQTRPLEASAHPHRHLLATISRFGGVRIWSKRGKLVASCSVMFNNKTPRNKVLSWPTLLWQKPDMLLLVDGKSELLECNPLLIDCKNRIEYRIVHALHKRGLYAIVSDAPRVQTAYDSPESPFFYEWEKWSVFTVSQDRNIIRYSMKDRKPVAIHNTCGGFLYNVQSCPYDAGKVAISVGDGAIRVWQSSTLSNDDTKLYPGRVTTYWQNVQGKVLTVAWHPTKENLLAFGTGESRVGILDTSGKNEKPAKVLLPALNGGIYSLCWGEGMQLFACGGSKLVVYDANIHDEAPEPIDVVVEGELWQVASVTYSPRGMLCGSNSGAVAVLHPTTYEMRAVAFAFNKMIHMMEWHPVQTSSSSEESAYKNLIAVCSLDKNSNVVILEYTDECNKYRSSTDEEMDLLTWKTLSGHKMPVLQVAWNPHRDELLLSTSQDTTVRVWDIIAGTCVSIFGGHSAHSLGATWLAMPQFDTKIMSGAGDCCLRLWDYRDHTPRAYEKIKHETSTKTKKPDKKENKVEEVLQKEEAISIPAINVPASNMATSRKPARKYLLPIVHRQMNPCRPTAVQAMFYKFVLKEPMDPDTDMYDTDFIRLFGSVNEINEILDMELNRMLEDGNIEAWITLCIFRGHIDSMIRFASQRDMLCPYLISMAPCVSYKYWKDVVELYINQMNRMMARGEDEKLNEYRQYGGVVFKKTSSLLSIHDVKGAIATLVENKLYRDAYILCRIRYMDSFAEDILRQWAKYSYYSGNLRVAGICYIALNNLSEAATVLAKCNDQESLHVSAELAKITGRTTFADHVEKKAQSTPCIYSNKTQELLKVLPSKVELIMKKVKESEESFDPDVQNQVSERVKKIPSILDRLMQNVLDDDEPTDEQNEINEEVQRLPSRIEMLMKDILQEGDNDSESDEVNQINEGAQNFEQVQRESNE